MGTFSLSHWLGVLAIVLILFGAGRIPKAMGDLARGGGFALRLRTKQVPSPPSCARKRVSSVRSRT
jgi:sec-independent protein translocase protein TatA